MADGSRKTGKRSKTKKKRTPQTVNKSERPAVNALPKLEREGVTIERVPSNAPTMAIAPSDYEHIFHEAATGQNQSPPAPSQPPPIPQLQLPQQQQHRLPQAPLPPVPMQQSQQPMMRARTPEGQYQQEPQQLGYDPNGGGGQGRYAAEVQVTPDGYTMLGHPPDPNPQRRIALPAHIVRASNQFSRAALQRVARYLASRAEQPRM